MSVAATITALQTKQMHIRDLRRDNMLPPESMRNVTYQ
jgi:hypothetical protein